MGSVYLGIVFPPQPPFKTRLDHVSFLTKIRLPSGRIQLGLSFPAELGDFVLRTFVLWVTNSPRAKTLMTARRVFSPFPSPSPRLPPPAAPRVITVRGTSDPFFLLPPLRFQGESFHFFSSDRFTLRALRHPPRLARSACEGPGPGGLFTKSCASGSPF